MHADVVSPGYLEIALQEYEKDGLGLTIVIGLTMTRGQTAGANERGRLSSESLELSCGRSSVPIVVTHSGFNLPHGLVY